MTAQLQLNLTAARRARDAGVAKVSAKNGTWLETMRGVARRICREKGWVCADDLRAWCNANNFQPTHFNAFGAVFRTTEFVPGEYIVSKQVQGHSNRVRKWYLRTQS